MSVKRLRSKDEDRVERGTGTPKNTILRIETRLRDERFGSVKVSV
jgi:hypothetical protein